MKGSQIREILKDLKLGSNTDTNLFDEMEFKLICDKTNLTSQCLYFCGDKKFWPAFQEKKPKDSLVVFSHKLLEQVDDQIADDFIYASVENVPLAMSYLSRPFYEGVIKEDNDEVDGRQLGTCEIHPTAMLAQNVFIGAHVKIGPNVSILPGCVVSSFCEIDEGTTLFPNVTLMPRTVIGKDCRIHSGTVIGSDGFGYNYYEGVHHKLWHMGGVRIGNNVEMGSNVSVDQGTFSPTIIGNGVKIDNLVQVAHNCQLGDGVILCGQAGVAGSAKLGPFSVFGGGARVAPDVEVGAGAQVGGMAGVTANIDDKAAVAGFPARPVREWLKSMAQLRKLGLKK